jgi:hypothetical protein
MRATLLARFSGGLANCAEPWLRARAAAARLLWARLKGRDDLLHIRFSVLLRSFAISAIYRFAFGRFGQAEISPQAKLSGRPMADLAWQNYLRGQNIA